MFIQSNVVNASFGEPQPPTDTQMAVAIAWIVGAKLEIWTAVKVSALLGQKLSPCWHFFFAANAIAAGSEQEELGMTITNPVGRTIHRLNLLAEMCPWLRKEISEVCIFLSTLQNHY
ncbi:MAG: hypothetical protein F6K55_03185 [Moorea sp. SIO4A3]|nr:hypothetical protein [Moorena sp. SIO4A3]